MSDLTKAPELEEETIPGDQTEGDDEAELEEVEGEPGTESETEDDAPAIEYKGAKYKVDPAVKEAYEAMQAETTRKFQEAAEVKRQVEAAKAETEKLNGLRATFYREIGQVENLNTQLAEYDKVDWLRWEQQDPDACRAAKIERLTLLHQRDQTLGSIQAKVNENTRLESEQLTKKRQLTETEIRAHIKDWSPQREAQLQKFTESYGFSAADFATTVPYSSGLARLVHDAFMYRQSQKKAPQLKSVTTVTKVMGSAPAQKDPDKMTMPEWTAWMDRQESAKRKAIKR